MASCLTGNISAKETPKNDIWGDWVRTQLAVVEQQVDAVKARVTKLEEKLTRLERGKAPAAAPLPTAPALELTPMAARAIS